MKALRGACVVACLLLAGCVTVPNEKGAAIGELSAVAEAAATASQQAREQRLQALPTLAFSGRVALSSGRSGGSGRIEWRQSGERYEVTLSAPVSRQSWRLTGDAASARIEGIEGGPRSDTDVARLLREATGLDIPVGAMAAWAGGARADAAAFGPARLEFTADGQLARIEQDGWTVDYLGWREEQPGDGQPPLLLPDRINAARGEARVRLAIDAWSWAPEAP
ncbi:MAG: lipoprotein insertase outer membrane protein LolB [Luteimonas sp.]|nr:lipoprotein insertase outer membrane protein LolB [Luteimonas sp.]